MIKIKQTIIVEGKHDKIKLKSIVDANIITTDGFRICNNVQKRGLIKKIAAKTGIIILTDSDYSGRMIRNFIRSCMGYVNFRTITDAYIPKILGKEKRKSEPSKEGLLGVEGINEKLLIDTLLKYGATVENYSEPAEDAEDGGKAAPGRKVTKTDFYLDGLSGGRDSKKKRKYLCEKLEIPLIAANALIECINILTDYDEYKRIIGEYNE